MSSPKNFALDSSMTKVMNTVGQLGTDGTYAASRLPIKNRINQLDVSSRKFD